MPHLTFTQNVWAVFGGMLTGALFSLIGGGGSALAIPILTTLVGLGRIRLAIGTTAVSVAATAIAATLFHALRGRVEWRAVVIFTGPGLIGVIIGGRLQNDLSSRLLMTLLGVILLVNACFVASLSLKTRHRESAGQPGIFVRIAPAGLMVGVLAGMFGLGGNFLALPSMLLGGLSLTMAVGSSVVSAGSLGMASALRYSLRGLVDWRVVILYTAGGLFGSALMAPLARKVSSGRAASLVMAVVLTGIALYLIGNNVGSLYSQGPLV